MASAAIPDLSRPVDVGGILGGAFRLYRRRFWLFAAIAFAVVLPVDLIVYGVAGELLWNQDDFADSLPPGVLVASILAPIVVIIPLVTAGHVLAVIDLAEGRETSAGKALSAAMRRFPAVAIAVTLAWIGSCIGLVFLVVPGVYLYVRWFVAAQAVVAEDLDGTAGLSRSTQLVKGDWWRTFGIVILIHLIGFMLVLVLGVPALAAGAVAESGPLTLVGQILLDAVVYSFTALAGTLLYFDLRGRNADAPAPFEAPERP